MEKLIFALIASYAYRPQERVVAEAEEFQPFDLQTLRNRHVAPHTGRRPGGVHEGVVPVEKFVNVVKK